MADKTVSLELKIDASGAAQSVGDLKKSIVELKNQALQAGEDSLIGKQFLKQAGEAKDRLSDLNRQVDNFQDAGAKFGAVSKLVGGLAAGFQAAQGAAALFGSSGEDIQKIMLKVQSATALAQGVQGLAGLGESFKDVGAIIKGPIVGAFTALKGAIAATGIGLLVIALGAIVAYWDDIKGAVSGVSSEQDKLNKASNENLKTQQKKLDAIGGQDNILKLQGKSEKEILQIKIKQTDEVIAATEESIRNAELTKGAQIEAAQRNKDILEGILKFISLPITAVLKGIDLIGSAVGKNFGLEEKFFGGIAGFIFDPEATKSEADKTIEESKKAIEKLKNDRAGLQLSIKGIDQKTSDESKNAAKTDEELKKKQAETAEELKKKQADDFAALTEKEYAESIKSTSEYYDHLIALAKLNNEDTTALENKKAEELIGIGDEYGQKTLAQQDALLLEKKKQKEDAAKKEVDDAVKLAQENLSGGVGGSELANQIALENALYEQAKIANINLEELEKKHIEKIAALKNASALKTVLAGIKMAQDSLSAIQNLTDVAYTAKLSNVKKGSKEEEAILRKQFETNKKMQIASAIINGALAVTNIIATVPKGDFGISTAIMLVGAASATAASVAKIAATKFDSAGGASSSTSFSGGAVGEGGGAAPGAPELTQPTTNIPQGTGTTIPETKVYVTETDIKRVTNRVNVIESRATFR